MQRKSKKKEIVRILLTDSLPSDKSFGGLRNNNKKKEKRPTGTANGTNIERYHLYKDVFGHLSYAMKNGFYIETIALLESAISDRLESVANVISNGTDYSYKTIKSGKGRH